jgi:predicted transcriptional regulator
VARALKVDEWVSLVRQPVHAAELANLVGVSITLAARLLGISRSRVHQLLNGKKLAAVDVYDERQVRIGHMVTLASIARRRRTVRPRRTQWRSSD